MEWKGIGKEGRKGRREGRRKRERKNEERERKRKRKKAIYTTNAVCLHNNSTGNTRKHLELIVGKGFMVFSHSMVID